MGFGLNNISELRSESPNKQPHLSKSSSPIEKYAGVINKCIIKVADKFNKSGQETAKVKSLTKIILDFLKGINNKSSSEESWRSIIKQDKTLSEKVMIVMSDLQILEINKDGEEIKIYDDRLWEFKQRDFNEEEYKKRVKKSIIRLFKIKN